MEDRVFIAGAGPVGLTAAAYLVRQGIPVTVFEGQDTLSTESRASTFHPPTLDMLDDLGFAEELVAQGLVAPKFQYRTKKDGLIASFDFATLSDVTRHPFRLQSEQYKLTRIIHAKLERDPNYRVEFGQRVTGVAQDADGVTITLAAQDGGTRTRTGRWLIGADGASSEVRKSLGVAFDGFTWPERFLVVSTPFDFKAKLPDLDLVSYVADPVQWYFYLAVPGLWRIMFPVPADVSDETAVTRDFARATMSTLMAGEADYEIAHTTLYRVHQRVAETFRVGRVFLAGDAAHINNPLGGMGMNGGVHDSLNLAERLARVWMGDAPDRELDRYDLQRRGITMEYVQKYTIQNKKNLETADPVEQARFRDDMRRIAADEKLRHEYLSRVSMISSLKRAAELG